MCLTNTHTRAAWPYPERLGYCSYCQQAELRRVLEQELNDGSSAAEYCGRDSAECDGDQYRGTKQSFLGPPGRAGKDRGIRKWNLTCYGWLGVYYLGTNTSGVTTDVNRWRNQASLCRLCATGADNGTNLGTMCFNLHFSTDEL